MFTHSVGPKHYVTKTCRTQTARIEERECVARQAIETHDIVFYVDGVPIETVTEFKYLGQIISANDHNDAAVSLNIKKALMAWFRMFCILSHDTADSWVMGYFYLAVVQAKLLYSSETWVLSQRLLKHLKSFHN
jgi:hypothetical protein